MGEAVLTIAAVALVAAAAVVVWALLEARAFTLRHVDVPVLPPGSDPIRILHISDIHATPRQRAKLAWVASLGRQQVDFIINTGDNLAHPDAVAAVLDAHAPLLRTPGAFVYGSNDYYAPRPKNPLAYFRGPSSVHGTAQELPVGDLTSGLTSAGWIDLTNARATVTLKGLDLALVGLDDPHLERDRLPDPGADGQPLVTIGVVHAPYARALDALRVDGADVILAGHTHGGQVCVPGYGALVTNCDLPRSMAKGLHRWPPGEPKPARASSAWLHVSAGIGTSPFARIRLACRPEATILTLVPRPVSE